MSSDIFRLLLHSQRFQNGKELFCIDLPSDADL